MHPPHRPPPYRRHGRALWAAPANLCPDHNHGLVLVAHDQIGHGVAPDALLRTSERAVLRSAAGKTGE